MVVRRISVQEPEIIHNDQPFHVVGDERIAELNLDRVRVIQERCADHGFNASTFTSRVVASTHAGLISSVLAGLCALKGPLHGGAPGPTLDLIDAAERQDDLACWLEAKLRAGERLMGFGHRVFHGNDPRAAEMFAAMERMEPNAGRLALAKRLESAVAEAVGRVKPGRTLPPNVEIAAALLLELALGDVVADAIARDVVERLRLGDVAGLLADDDAELDLPVHGVTGTLDVAERVVERGRELGEGGGAGQLVGLALEYIAMQHHNTAAPSALYELIPRLMKQEPGIDFFQAVARSGLRLNETLAPEIFKLTATADPGAMYAVTRTAAQHANDVIGIARQLGISDQPITIIRAGGLHTAGNKVFDAEFEKVVLGFLSGASLKVLAEAPVMGALQSAIGGLNG